MCHVYHHSTSAHFINKIPSKLSTRVSCDLGQPQSHTQSIAWKLDCDLQKLVDEFSIQPAKFTSFLFENYLKYFGALGDAQKTADILSFSLGLLENWENHELLLMALWTAVSGVMIFNEHKVSKWNQIKAPRKIERRIKSIEEGPRLHPTDGFYYNILTKSSKYPVFKFSAISDHALNFNNITCCICKSSARGSWRVTACASLRRSIPTSHSLRRTITTSCSLRGTIATRCSWRRSITAWCSISLTWAITVWLSAWSYLVGEAHRLGEEQHTIVAVGAHTVAAHYSLLLVLLKTYGAI
ncbi:hypothetical protein HUJ05_010539 [Dendroctonus ponderosae]|nr:hypothetical protein HUJ05_010539 [Dendroctonus ponderosae]